MQGSELRVARKALGLTQADLAEALGLSSAFVGMMERDEKAIEKRTEMAVRYLDLRASIERSMAEINGMIGRGNHTGGEVGELRAVLGSLEGLAARTV
ncbi:MAG: helix-turn-helix domain-containing protein [Sphingomonadales bacterium]|nr:helix-turn-helix domain-containing protein [Sphingomonadales bacterium]MDE2171191.1 helix-turn-helix domain-containing protein [Sphingomonadales bacterium]